MTRLPMPLISALLALSLSACGIGADTTPAGTTSPTLPSGISERTIYYNTDYDDGYATVRWGGGLFADMQESRQDLALVAAALCASAGMSEDASVPKDHYIARAYEELGMDYTLYNYPVGDADVSHQTIGREDEHCFAIGYADIDVGGVTTHVVCITLRGTESNWEMLGDFSAKPDREFRGHTVYDYWDDFERKVWEGLAVFIQDHPALATGPAKVVIGGHSLGGGAANLLTARFDYALAGPSDESVDDLGWEGPADVGDVIAFTFGALNVFGQDAGTGGLRSDDSIFDNIYNVFNELDTYGPEGEGTVIEIPGVFRTGFKPGYGGEAIDRKFGAMSVFRMDYREVFSRGDDHYANHVMQGYVRAVAEEIVSIGGRTDDSNWTTPSDGPLTVILYTDGDLVFQYGDSTDPGREIAEKWVSSEPDGSDLFQGHISGYRDAYEPVWACDDRIVSVSSRCVVEPLSNLFGLFFRCSSLSDISGLASWDVSSLKSMNHMFSGCTSLTDLSPISSWNTSSAGSMRAMFSSCTSLTDLFPISFWDTSSVQDMVSMFSGCTSLSDATPLNRWNVSSAADMSDMFPEYLDKRPVWY